MALILQTDLDSGLTANYWRVSLIQYDPVALVFTITMGLYASAQARASDKPPALYKCLPAYNIDIPTVTSVLSAGGTDVVANVYAYIKTLPEFAGAVDA